MKYIWPYVILGIVIAMIFMFICVVGGDGGPAVEDDSVWKHRLGTILMSYTLFIGIGMVAWNNTVNSTINRINVLCGTVSKDAPCSRSYVLALLVFSIARSLFLIVAGLVVAYFGSQMTNIMVEYMPHAFSVSTGFFRCISYTDYTFRAVEPSTVPVHAAALVLSLFIAAALTLCFLTDEDLTLATAVRRKLTYMIIVIPAFMGFLYFASCVTRMIR